MSVSVLVDCSVVMLWTEAVTVYVKRGSTEANSGPTGQSLRRDENWLCPKFVLVRVGRSVLTTP